MGFPRDFLRESQRDGMGGRRPAPQWGGGQAISLPFHPDDFPEGNPKENPYFPDSGL